jgi:hypothetical protein
MNGQHAKAWAGPSNKRMQLTQPAQAMELRS